MMFWKRVPTIGDYIAESLINEADDWQLHAHPPMGLFWCGDYSNARHGWRLAVSYGMYGRSVSFNQCALTWREERRIFRALERRDNAEARRRRDNAQRRVAIRAVQ